MGQPYVGEIRMFAGNFAPAGWAFCDGSLQAIDENQTLFSLIGTTYGGDGQATFALPDLRGRVPLNNGTGTSGTTYVIGSTGGVESVTLSTNQIPSHTHVAIADDNTATTNNTDPSNKYYGNPTPTTIYSARTTTLKQMASLSSTGGSQPHDNLQPFLAVSFIISLFGIYPSQS